MLNKDRIKYLRNVIENSKDFDYSDMRLCVAGQCHKHFSPVECNPYEFTKEFLELNDQQASFLLELQEGNGFPYVGYGEANKDEALARIDSLIGEPALC